MYAFKITFVQLTCISALGIGGLPVSESYRFRLDLKFADG